MIPPVAVKPASALGLTPPRGIIDGGGPFLYTGRREIEVPRFWFDIAPRTGPAVRMCRAGTKGVAGGREGDQGNGVESLSVAASAIKRGSRNWSLAAGEVRSLPVAPSMAVSRGVAAPKYPRTYREA